MKKQLALALALLLILGTMLTGCGDRSEAGSQSDIGAKPGESEAPAEDEPVITISLSKFKEYASTSSGLWEFLQRFFTDTIVYRDSLGNYVYAPVDETLPKSDYNFDNLVNVRLKGKEFEYVEDGVTTSIKGIDVSQYQGDIDWEKVADDGVKFVFIRAGYRGYGTGKLVQDSKFEDNIIGALKNGIAVGVYFVPQSISVEEAIEEADFVLDMIKPYNVTWPIVLDLENAGTATSPARTADLTAEERTTYVLAFCDRIKEFGYLPMLYSNIGWYMDRLELSRLTLVDKWFAQYFNRPFFPYEFTVWQYTDSGSVDGIKGNVDFDISFKDYGEGEN